METAIAYIRVSDPRQLQGTSLESQSERVNQYVEFKGYQLNRLFVEEGESAKTDDRHVLQEMLGYARANKGRIEVLIFPKVDRFARYAEDYHFLKAYLRKLGIRVESTDERFDDSPSGRYMENMLAATAQYDNELRAERSYGGMKRAALQGRWVFGRAPVGYRKTIFDGKPTIEPDPKTARLIGQAFRRLASKRFSPQRVRRWLVGNGLSLSRTRFYEVIRSRTYLGIITSFGLEVEAAAPFVPLVSEAVFCRAQEAIQPKTYPKAFERDNASFPLRGTVRCECGAFMTASWSKGRSKKYPYYRCKACRKSNFRREEVERAFERALRLWKGRYGITSGLSSQILTVWKDEQAASAKRRVAIEQKIIKLGELQKAVVQKNLDGIIPDALAKEQLLEMQAEQGRKKAELEELSQQKERPDQVVEFAGDFLGHLGKHWRSSDLETQKQIQRFFYPSGATALLRIGRTAKSPASTGSGDSSPSKLSALVDRSVTSPHQKGTDIPAAIEWLKSLFREFHRGPSSDVYEGAGTTRRG